MNKKTFLLFLILSVLIFSCKSELKYSDGLSKQKEQEKQYKLDLTHEIKEEMRLEKARFEQNYFRNNKKSKQ